MTTPSTLALLGGPESGKSTFLGALVDALQAEQLPSLKLRQLPADARAYRRLSDPLLAGRYPQRTKAERHVLDLPLRAFRDGAVEDLTLSVGDYDGEEVERLFKNRTAGFTSEWRARACARGLLLFLRPGAFTPLPRLRLREAPTDQERWAAVRGSAPESAPRPRSIDPLRPNPERVFGPGLTAEPAALPAAAPDEAVRVPSVLAVIELLQFLRHVRGLAPGEHPSAGELRIALLISAWDAVDTTWRTEGPRRFLLEQAPLLDDFLWSNFYEDDVFCFALSSTAGDLNDPAYQERYLEDPHGFIVWTDATGTARESRNLALPIAWVLFGDDALADVPASGQS